MYGTSGIKHQARRFLKNNWGKAMAVLGVSLVVALIFTTIAQLYLLFVYPYLYPEIPSESNYNIRTLVLAITALIAMPVYYFVRMFLEAPVHLGLLEWHYALVSGDRAPFNLVFSYFQRGRYGRSINYALQRFFRIYGWVVLVFAPTVLCAIASIVVEDAEAKFFLELASDLSFWLAAGGAIAIIIMINLRYFLVPYLIAGNPALPVTAAFRTSVRYMKGFKWQVASLWLSLLGCIILQALGLPQLFVSPYINTCFANSARWIIITNIEKEQIALNQGWEWQERF
ncbi:MAG: DUF975 family protein [Oscillospiraceae bacterium]|jgi:uncharacterized membrane protein|nr:DUF975 family protein [Oscillospiraceae bacterium]